MTRQTITSQTERGQNRSVQMLWKMSVIRSSWICNCHKRRKPDGNGFLIDQVHVISSVNAMVKQTALCSHRCTSVRPRTCRGLEGEKERASVEECDY